VLLLTRWSQRKWDFCTIKRQTHQSPIPWRHHLRGPLLPLTVRTFDARLLLRQNRQGQKCLRAVRRQSRRKNSALPLQQRQVCRQRLQTIMQKCQAMTHLLWGKCPFPKWDCRGSNPRPLRERAQAIIACTRLLASSSPPGPLAIHSAQCGPPF
jgi:hypothetical protein